MLSHLKCLVVLTLCASASAGTFGIRWKDNPTSPTNTVGYSGKTVEVWIELLPGENLSGVNFDFEDVAPNLELFDERALLDGWNVAPIHGILDPQVANPGVIVFAETAPDNITDPGFYVVGEFDLRAVGTITTSPQFVSTDTHDHAGVGILGVDPATGNARFYNWDARYNTSYAGYFAYGDYGNPGWQGPTGVGGQPTPNPLIANLVPEPLTAILLALGGVTLLRRNRTL